MTCGGRSWAGHERGSEILCVSTHRMGSTPPPRIALASSIKELHQVVALSNRHPPKILPKIYPSADLPSLFIRHFTNKVQKLRANIAAVHVTSTLVTGTTTATFSSLEKVSQSTVKECIFYSVPKSCELDPIPPNS